MAPVRPSRRAMIVAISIDAGDPEVGLLPRGGGDLLRGEELAAVQAAREVEDAGALHDGVVDVEEGGRGRVAGPDEGVLDLRRRRRGLAREGRALLQVEAPGPLGRGHPASVAAGAAGAGLWKDT